MPPSVTPTANSQMNVRIDRALKERGDAALLAAGFSPTEAIRALWHLACGSEHDLGELAKLLSRGRALERGEAVQTDVGPLEAGWALYAGACAELGFSPMATAVPSDKELLEQALLDRLVEKGLA